MIHQKNAGSVAARKAGVMHAVAQTSKYLTFCDADDTIHPKMLEKMYQAAEHYSADSVCIDMTAVWKGMPVPKQYRRPCFAEQKVRCYSHEEIISQLYISCFGITNFPVTLWGKLYETHLLTRNMERDSVVKFMGDDLNYTLTIMPEVKRLVIIPEQLYYYRMGGNTSKFMPFMLDDFLSLYRLKKEMAKKWIMPQNVEYLMGVELINILKSWLYMCATQGNYSNLKMEQEIVKLCSTEEIKQASQCVIDNNKLNNMASWIQTKDYQAILEYIKVLGKKNCWKRIIKNILNRLP